MSAQENRSKSERSPQANRIRLGRLLEKYNGRILGGIRMSIDKSSGHPSRYKYFFIKLEDEPALIVKNRRYRPPSWEETLREKQPPGWEQIIQEQEASRKKQDNPQPDTSKFGETAPSDPQIGGGACQSVSQFSQNPIQAAAETNKTTPRRTKNVHGGDALFKNGGPLDTNSTVLTDRLTTPFLALDLETCAEVRVQRRGIPKIVATKEALNPWKGEIRLVTLADGTGAVQSFDLRDGALPDEIRTGLERCPLIVHNACFDLLFLKVRLGIVPATVFCTMTASRLLQPSRSVSHSLGAVLERYLGIKLPKEHGGSDWGGFVLTDSQIAYAHDDVRHLHKLEVKLRAELKLSRLEEIFELEMNLIPIVVAVEQHGFAVDRARLETLRSTTADSAARLVLALRDKFALPTLNLDSPPQLLEAFKAADVDINATDETTLSGWEDDRAKLILDYRGQAKLEDSIKGLLKAVGTDGRIHARFSPTGSLSGRFSSKEPNLQNITRGALRSCFVAAGPDRSLIVSDYSQIELRIGAHFAGDEVMLKAFRAKKDLHRATAATVLSKPLEKVTKADRQLAKAVNFGFLYGQGPKGFRQYARTEYGIVLSLEEATELRDKFFARYCGLAKWHQEAWEKAEKGISEARTVLGRLLLEQGEGRDWNRFQLHTSYRVSGSAADVLKLAMVKTVAMLPSDVLMVATVHDELIFDSPSAEAPQYSGMIRTIMEEAFKEVFGPELPIEVEAKVCANWAQK
jgi:DNA polymerase-1